MAYDYDHEYFIYRDIADPNYVVQLNVATLSADYIYLGPPDEDGHQNIKHKVTRQFKLVPA